MKQTSHTKVAKDTKIGKLISEIREHLDVVMEYIAWLIKPEARFRIGQRVEFSHKARRGNIVPKTRQDRRGTIKGLDSFSVVVQIDGYSKPRSFHHSFFNPVSGPKLF